MDARASANAPKQEIRLADYQPPAFSIETIDLVFRLEDEVAVVEATSNFKREGDVRSLTLDGGPYMSLKRVALNGVELGGNAYS
nr:hypothetical protein [Kordiimonas gwangyangensis]